MFPLINKIKKASFENLKLTYPIQIGNPSLQKRKKGNVRNVSFNK
jgi:hypothetical protein